MSDTSRLQAVAESVVAGASVRTLLTEAFASTLSVADARARLEPLPQWLDVQPAAVTAENAVDRAESVAIKLALLEGSSREMLTISTYATDLHETLTELARAGVLAQEAPSLRELVGQRLGALETAVETLTATR
jgi:hypothetical protein